MNMLTRVSQKNRILGGQSSIFDILVSRIWNPWCFGVLVFFRLSVFNMFSWLCSVVFPFRFYCFCVFSVLFLLFSCLFRLVFVFLFVCMFRGSVDRLFLLMMFPCVLCFLCFPVCVCSMSIFNLFRLFVD